MELRTRSQVLSKELLDLVNDNYQDFLGLGGSLRGGEEKVEEVRVGLLGFRRDVETLKEKVAGRRKEVEGLLGRRRAIAKEVRLGRALLEVDLRLEELEERLMVATSGSPQPNDANNEDVDDFTESEEDGDEDGVSNSIPLSRLRRRAQQYIYIRRMVAKIGPEHPFLVRQEERILRIRQTLLLDLSTALKQGTSLSDADKARVLRVLGIYRDMGESDEALMALKRHDL